MTTLVVTSLRGFDAWLEASPYRIDAWAQYAGQPKQRTAYAVVDQFGWAIITRDRIGRVDGHTRAARAAVINALGAPQTGAAADRPAANGSRLHGSPSAASGTERGADALGAVPRDALPVDADTAPTSPSGAEPSTPTPTG